MESISSKGLFPKLACMLVAATLIFSYSETLWTTYAASQNYYVDCVNGSDNFSGDSEERPWQTLAPVKATTFLPGDSIYFKRGCVWNTGEGSRRLAYLGLVLNTSGSQDQPISFTNYGDESEPLPVFTNPGDYAINARVIQVNASWIILDGFKIEDSPSVGIGIEPAASNNKFRNLEMTQVGVGFDIYGSHNEIHNSTIHDLHMVINTNDQDGDDYGALGMILRGSYNDIAFNTFKNCIAESYDYGTDGGVVDFFASNSTTESVGNRFHHNWFEANNGIVELGSTNNASFIDNIFAYNVMVNNGRLVTVHLDDRFKSKVRGLGLSNNTIYENVLQYPFAAERRLGLLMSFSGQPSADTIMLRNNIFYTQGITQFSNQRIETRDHNLYYMIEIETNSYLDLSLNPSELQADPFFVDVDNFDFRLKARSLAIDGGINGAYPYDFAGNTAPINGVYDLGAYEFSD